MDSGDKSFRPGFEKYGILFVLLAAGGIFYWSNPLVPSRPPEHSLSVSKSQSGWVYARLWQDPLEAAKNAPKESRETAANKPPTLKKGTLVLAVYLAGGDTIADTEHNLRTRYAVLTGLQTAGYVTEEIDRLFFFQMEKGWAKDSTSGLFVPFEWLKKDPLRKTANKHEHILVLWVDGNPMYVDPLKKLLAIAKKIPGWKKNITSGEVEWRVIGPLDSDMLGSLLDETAGSQDAFLFWKDLKLFSPWATANESVMGQLNSKCSFGELGSDRVAGGPGRRIQRTIANDRELVELLVAELKTRGIDLESGTKGDRVVLLSEWDTSYGRALPLTFAAVTWGAQNCKSFEESTEILRDTSQWPKQIRRVMYMRGLDGSRPGGQIPDKNESTKSGRRTSEPDANDIERPEGERQLDYARRMADQLALENGDAIGAVKAIGVLGSDIYDKLLLLQALRPRFPNAVFFTTDLDARLLHPSESSWARNVVIASSFGLDVPRELRDGGERSTSELASAARGQPPFRDNYQTATYFAVLRALESITPKEIQCASEPWIYEIGRTRAHRLPSKSQKSGNQIAYLTREMDGLKSRSTWIATAAGVAFLIIFVLVILHILFGPAMWKDSKWWVTAGSLFGYVAVAAIVLVIASRRWGPPEPFTWIEGISIWPTEILRFITGLLAIYFLIRVHQRIKVTNQAIRSAFVQDSLPNLTGVPPNFWRRSLCLLVKGPFAELDTLNGVWSRYECCSLPKYRWPRVLLLCVLYLLFAICVFAVFGWPVVPYRGAGSKLVDRAALAMSAGAQLLLIFYVVETILLTERLVRRLVSGLDNNPPEFLNGWRGDPREPERRAWLTIDLIARLTSTISLLIVYPFVVLSLMIISRLSYFDRWDWPPSLIAVLGLNAVFALGSGFFLSRTATRARKQAHEGLRWFQFGALRNGKAAQADDISKVMADIESEQRGAFAPLQAHPVLGAIALPSSTVVFTAILEYLDRTV